MRWFALCILMLPLAAAGENFQVSGVAVDHLSNQPLHRVLVNLISQGKDGGSVSAITESDGHFLFTEVPKGKYRLTAQRPGEAQQGFHQDDQGFGTAIVVGGATPTENLTFPLRSNGWITGLVTDEQGDPVKSAQVILFLQSVVGGEVQTSQNRSGVTNASGQFHFGRLRPGIYYVAVTGRPWYSTAGQPRQEQKNATDVVFSITWYGNTTVGEAASPIALAEGATANIQISMHAVPAVHVQLAGVSKTEGFQGATVYDKGPGGVRVPVFADMSTNRDGTREITGITAGHYEVALINSGGAEMRAPATQAADLTEGATLTPPREGQLSISGQVTFVGGDRPDRELELFINSGSGRSAMAPISADGSFSVPNNQLGAGSYDIHLNTPGLWIQSFTVRGGKRAGEKIELPASGTVVLSIVAATEGHLSKLSGYTVRDGVAYAGAAVLLVPQDLSETKLIRRDQSDSDGSFHLSGIVAGRYTLVAIDEVSGLLYKTASVMKPYLAGGVSVTIPSDQEDGVKVETQKRVPAQ